MEKRKRIKFRELRIGDIFLFRGGYCRKVEEDYARVVTDNDYDDISRRKREAKKFYIDPNVTVEIDK